ncbi:MAG: hypothetical protein JO031_06635 [Ktedonobacteraceae bacterium]|nr:hypothetical protein [Ktedonobacteraceae bacterium]
MTILLAHGKNGRLAPFSQERGNTSSKYLFNLLPHLLVSRTHVVAV